MKPISRAPILPRIAAILVVMCSRTAAGGEFEFFPEFHSLMESEPSLFEGPLQIDPEYQSDLLSYHRPDRWHYLWLSQERGLELSGGSTNSQLFSADNRLKVHHHLNPWLQFRFTYFDDGSAEDDSAHHMTELIAWPTPWLGAGIYSEFGVHKRETDTGVAAFLRPGTRHEIRLFHTWVDVARIKRSDRNDTFLEPNLPRSRGLVGRWWGDPESKEEEFVEYSFRHEPLTIWRFRDTGIDFRYWKAVGSLYGSKRLRENVQLSVRVQADRKFEATQTQAWARNRLLGVARLHLKGIGPHQDWELTPGAMYAYRFWSAGGGKGHFRDILPFASLRVPGWGSGENRGAAEIGYVLTHHSESFQGGIPRQAGVDFDDTFEHQLNLVYEFGFGPAADLRLVTGLDLDQLLSREFWNGGAAELRLAF